MSKVFTIKDHATRMEVERLQREVDRLAKVQQSSSEARIDRIVTGQELCRFIQILQTYDQYGLYIYKPTISGAVWPAMAVFSGDASLEAVYVENTNGGRGLKVKGLVGGGSTEPVLYLEKGSGTGRILDTSVSGCYLTNGGVWTSTCKSSKKIFLPLEWSAEEHLEKVKSLEVLPFDYRKDDLDPTPTGERHFGPTAEQFKEIFGIGDGEGIAALDLASVGLLAVQSLVTRVEALEAEVKSLRAVVEAK